MLTLAVRHEAIEGCLEYIRISSQTQHANYGGTKCARPWLFTVLLLPPDDLHLARVQLPQKILKFRKEGFGTKYRGQRR